MKKIYISLVVLAINLTLYAQTVTFESAEIGSMGGAIAMWSGSVDVKANTYTIGNTSSKVLHVLNTGSLPIYFSNVALPAGTAATYTYSKLRVKYLVIGGTDTGYPSLDIFSSPNSTTATSSVKIGTLAWTSLWAAAEIGVWKTIEFTFANSLLATIPAGNLILKLNKTNTEYLIDDVELVLSGTPENGFLTVEDFESKNSGDVLNMKRWALIDGTSTVEANPTDATKKSVHIITSANDALLKLNVTLPSGKIVADYENISFDIYMSAAYQNNYKKMQIYIDGTKVYEDAGYPSQATVLSWTPKSYALTNLAGGNAFVLDLGISTPGGNYFIDNIKLKQKSGITDMKQLNENPILIYYSNNNINLSKLANQVAIYEVNGHMLISQKNTSIVNVSNLERGIYIVKAVLNGQTTISKVSK